MVARQLSRLPGVDRKTFIKIFATDSTQQAKADKLFGLYEGAVGRGKADVLEVFAAATLASKASPGERKKFGFQLFDFDGSKTITKDEFVIMLRSALLGLAKLTSGDPPSLPECEATAEQAFEQADEIADGRITYVEWSNWMRRNRVAKNLMQSFDRSGKLRAGLGRRGSGAAAGEAATSGSDALDAALGIRGGAGGGKDGGKGGGKGKAGARKRGKAPPKGSAEAEAARRAKKERLAAEQTGRVLRQHFNSAAKRPAHRNRSEAGQRYSRADVRHVQRVFADLDTDGSGRCSIHEFAVTLSSSMVAHLSGMFAAIDKDNSGDCTFPELLRAMYPAASKEEIARMLSWAAPPPPKPKKEYQLSEEEKKEVRQLFQLYDKDGSGQLSVGEMVLAMSRTGGAPAELLSTVIAVATLPSALHLSLPLTPCAARSR